jgi:hypothetical protein
MFVRTPKSTDIEVYTGYTYNFPGGSSLKLDCIYDLVFINPVGTRYSAAIALYNSEMSLSSSTRNIPIFLSTRSSVVFKNYT